MKSSSLLLVVLLVGCSYDVSGNEEVVMITGEESVSNEKDDLIWWLNSSLESERVKSDLLYSDAVYWKSRFDNLKETFENESLMKSDYNQVMEACLASDSTFDTSGVLAFNVCPECSSTLDCISNSMAPLINCASSFQVHEVFSVDDVQVCDVIVFESAGWTLVHRVWEVYEDGEGVTRFSTVGDNSDNFDSYDPMFEDILGEVGLVIND